jgi:hypothetical protein
MAIWAAAILVLRREAFVRYAVEHASILYGFHTIMGAFIPYAFQIASGGMIYIPSFTTIVWGIQVILRLLPQHSL